MTKHGPHGILVDPISCQSLAYLYLCINPQLKSVRR